MLIHKLMALGLRCLRGWWFLTHPITVGTRAIVLNEKGEVALVRHTYQPGWYLPGGTIGKRETVVKATTREVFEETGIECIGEPDQLLGVYTNFTENKSDHIVVFVFSKWRQHSGKVPNLEIAETGFYHPDKLPPGTTPGTIKRLLEFAKKQPLNYEW